MSDLAKIVIDASNYSLNSTFESSFAQYLFRDSRSENEVTWTGIVAPIKNSRITQRGSEVHFQVNPSTDEDTKQYLTLYVTGLWHDPPVAQYPESVSKVISEQPGIRVPWLFRNKWHVLLSTLLSVHAKVSLSRAWFSCLHHFSIEDLAKGDPLELRDLTEEVTGVSAGFRMRYVVETASALIATGYRSLDDFPSTDPAVLRTILLRIRNLGPKVVDCFLLNAMGDLSAVPIDVHVGRVSGALGLVPIAMGHPQHYLCRQFVCRQEDSDRTGANLCPKAKLTSEIMRGGPIDPRYGCVRSALSSTYDKAGWLQAHLFRYGQTRSLPYSRQRRQTLPRARRISMQIESKPVWPEIEIFRHFGEFKSEIESIAEGFAQELARSGLPRKVTRAFALWKSCRDKGLPLLLSEVQIAFGVTYSDIVNLQKTLPEIEVSPLKHDALIEMVRRELGLTDQIIDEAKSLNVRMRRILQNPKTAVALAIYLASNQSGRRMTQKEIAKALGLTEVTIRNGLRRLDSVQGLGSESVYARTESRHDGAKADNKNRFGNKGGQRQRQHWEIEQAAEHERHTK